MNMPFWCPPGHVLRYGERLMRFEEGLGDRIMRFRYVDGDEEIVRVPARDGGGLGMPTVEWILAGFRAGTVVDPQYRAETTDRRQDVLHLDRPACEGIDPKSAWRFDWADAALASGVRKTKEDYAAWIARNDFGGPKPNATSLLRWTKTLKDFGGRIGSLVAVAGRERGHSQLPDVEDRLVHKWAMRYWRPSTLNGRLAHKEDAAAMVVADWDELKELGISGLSEEPPSSETVRLRINGLECHSTYASRYGRPEADRRFSPAEEPVEVDHPFERIFLDGVEWEHSVFYSADVKVPAAKMKSVIAMDAFSQYVFDHPTFCGPFRTEMGMSALRAVMLPPEMSQEEIEADPELSMIYSLPGDVMIDRDRTLIPPAMVPGSIKIFSTLELAEAYHSDAKAKLENYHRFCKSALRMVRGRILGPRVRHALGYDPLAATEVTRAQYVDLLRQCRRRWNSKPKRSLGWRSPNDVMKAFLRTGAVRLTDPLEVRRTFARTPAKPCVLTVNGLTFDNVHYRFAREGTGRALDSNHHAVPFAKRLRDTVRLEVHIRAWDDDIDRIEVYDPENRTYFEMWSTDPGYTGGLSRWEHNFYQKAISSGKLGATGKADRLRLKARSLDEMQRTLSGRSFREREEPVAALEAEERRLSGRRGRNPGCAHVPELHVPTRIDGADREDVPTPPPQTKSPEKENVTQDVRSDPSRRIADELGETDALLGQTSWTFGPGDDEEEEEED